MHAPRISTCSEGWGWSLAVRRQLASGRDLDEQIAAVERLKLGSGRVRQPSSPYPTAHLLEGVFSPPRVEVWSGATIGRFEPWATAQMWLATALSGFCRVVIDRDRNTGLISPPGRHTAAVATVSGSTLAYVTTRNTTDEDHVEFDVHAYGPNAADLAEEVADQLRVWASEHRDGAGPQFRVDPVGTPEKQISGGRVVTKKHSRITVSWPQTAAAADVQGVMQEPH